MREDQVRELLGLAGETIDVGPGDVVETPARKRWPYVAGAAAAAVAIAASVLVGVALDDDDLQTADDPVTGVVEPVQVPAVYGMPVDFARSQLEAQGFRVEVRHVETCREPLGRSLRTAPAAGTDVDPGGAVVLEVAYQGNHTGSGDTVDGQGCNGRDLLQRRVAWQLVDFLEGWGDDGPEFVGPVTYIENGAYPRQLGLGATDPASYGILAERLRQQLALPGAWLRPHLDDGQDFVCAGRELSSFHQSRPSLWFEIAQPHEGPPSTCTMVNVFFENDDVPNGGITDVVLRSSDNPVLDELSDDAQAHAEQLDVDADAEAVALGFLTAIQPESPVSRSPYAEHVDLYIGNEYVRTVVGGTLHGEEAWRVCPSNGVGYAEAECPFSALEVVRHADPDTIVFTDEHPAYGMCADVFPGEEPPTGRFVVLGPAEPEACLMNWNVELYYDANQRITAVNLLHGEP